MKKIAVYGTLRQNEGNHHIMGKSRLLGTHLTRPNYTMYNAGGFPFVLANGITPITIEVYEVTDQRTLERIYGLEGYSGVRGSAANWYDTVDVETPWGLAEMFVTKSTQRLPVIDSGNWKVK